MAPSPLAFSRKLDTGQHAPMLDLSRRDTAERRMKPPTIIIRFDEFEQIPSCCHWGQVQFCFQMVRQSFPGSVVPTISVPARGRDQTFPRYAELRMRDTPNPALIPLISNIQSANHPVATGNVATGAAAPPIAGCPDPGSTTGANCRQRRSFLLI